MQFVFFLIYVVAVLTCGSIKVGPYSLRIYMSLLMLAYLLVFRRPASEKVYIIRTDYIILFLVCIVMLGISLTINGGLVAFAFWEKCLAYYLLCIIIYFATDRFVKNNTHFDKLAFILSLIVVFDTVVTILQYQNNPIGWGLGAIFSDVEEFAEFLNDHDSFVGVSKLPGIFGHPVNNGFFLSVVCPMMLTGIGNNKSFFRVLYFISVIVLTLIGLLLLQQRAAFFLVVIIVAYHFLRTLIKNPVKFILPAIVIAAIVFFIIPSNTGDIEMGRLASSDNSSRTGVWNWAFAVFLDSPLFGNILRYNQSAEYSAHNVLIDSLVDSGIVGFIPLFILYMKTVVDSLRIMLKTKNDYARVFSYSVLASMCMGMFHNTSYLTGEVIIFLSLALMFKAQCFSKKTISYQK